MLLNAGDINLIFNKMSRAKYSFFSNFLFFKKEVEMLARVAQLPAMRSMALKTAQYPLTVSSFPLNIF